MLSKRTQFVSVLIASAIFLIFAATFLYQSRKLGIDFVLRYNEIQCLKEGINPFDILTGCKEHDLYVSYFEKSKTSARQIMPNGYHRMVYGYPPPWAYTYLFLLGKLPIHIAWRVFVVINAIAFLFVSFWSYQRFLAITSNRVLSFICSAALFLTYSYVENCMTVGNYGILVCASIILMAECLNKSKSLLAGVFLAVIMVKPQIGLLFIIPLLMHRQYKTLVTGGLICLVAALLPAKLLNTSIPMLIAEVFKTGKSMRSTLILPAPLFSFLANLYGKSTLVILHLAIGACLTVLISHRMKNVRDWATFLVPTVVLATAWTYSHFHDKSIYILPVVILSTEFLCTHKRFEKLLP